MTAKKKKTTEPDLPRVHIAVPTYGNSPAICQLSFGSFIGHGVGAGLIRHIGEVEGAYIDRARNDLVRQALASDSTHIMFVDQDMIIPEGSLQRLLGHKVPVVGGIYFGKDDFFTPVAFHLDPFYRVYEVEYCPSIPTESPLPEGSMDCVCGKPDNHIHQVGGTGMGCTLVENSFLRDVEKHFGDQQWFSSKETGEDVHLAMRAKEMGIPWLMDGFIQCGHVRNQIVTRQHYEWARQSAPKCTMVDCTRTAQWDVPNADPTTRSNRCFIHREVT